MPEMSKSARLKNVTAWSVRGLAAVAVACAVVVYLGESVLKSAVAPSPTPATLATQGFGYTLDALTGAPVAGAAVNVDGQRFASDSQGVYKLDGLAAGEKVAVASRAGYAPTAVVFSVYVSSGGATSVHTPPAYLLAAQPAVAIPTAGGTLTHGLYSLSFASGGFSASLTGYGEHPGAPAPPDTIPTPGAPQPPRSPLLGHASDVLHTFPQALFYATFATGQVAQADVPLSVAGADPVGSLLPLLRFNTGTGQWERENDLAVASSTRAQGSLSRSGLYLVATSVRILSDAVTPTADSVTATAPCSNSSASFTLPAAFSIEPGTSSDVRSAAVWFYGWRPGGSNLIGVQVTSPLAATQPSRAPRTGAATPAPTGPCPEGFKCPDTTVPCIINPITVNGCGSKLSYGGKCTCCREGESCQTKVKSGGALDEYDISIGIEEILRQIKAKGNKRKEDTTIEAGCYAHAKPAPAPSPAPTVVPALAETAKR